MARSCSGARGPQLQRSRAGQRKVQRRSALRTTQQARASLVGEYLQATKDAVNSGLNESIQTLDFSDTGTIAAAAALAAVPAVGAAVYFSFGEGDTSKPSKASPSKVYNGLDNETVLLDVRSKATVKEEGSPDVKPTGCKYVNIPYEASSDEFVSKANNKCATAKSVAVLGETPGIAASAAQELLSSGAIAVPVVYVSGDWRGAGLPWKEPGSGLSLPSLNADSESLTGALYAAGAIGASAFLAAEVDAILELVGIFGASSVLVKRFLFYEDRKRTLEELQRFLDERVAPAELIGDVSSAYRNIVGDDTSIAAQPSKQLEASVSTPAPQESSPGSTSSTAEPATASVGQGSGTSVASASASGPVAGSPSSSNDSRSSKSSSSSGSEQPQQSQNQQEASTSTAQPTGAASNEESSSGTVSSSSSSGSGSGGSSNASAT